MVLGILENFAGRILYSWGDKLVGYMMRNGIICTVFFVIEHISCARNSKVGGEKEISLSDCCLNEGIIKTTRANTMRVITKNQTL